MLQLDPDQLRPVGRYALLDPFTSLSCSSSHLTCLDLRRQRHNPERNCSPYSSLRPATLLPSQPWSGLFPPPVAHRQQKASASQWCLQSPVAPSSSEAHHLTPVASSTASPVWSPSPSLSNSPCPTPPFSPSEWLCSLNTLCSEAPIAQNKGNREGSLRACRESHNHGRSSQTTC